MGPGVASLVCGCPRMVLSPHCDPQEYTLAHLEVPTTLEGSSAALRRFQDFRASMESSAGKVPEVVAGGTKLVAEGNIFAEKITEKCQTLQER